MQNIMYSHPIKICGSLSSLELRIPLPRGLCSNTDFENQDDCAIRNIAKTLHDKPTETVDTDIIKRNILPSLDPRTQPDIDLRVIDMLLWNLFSDVSTSIVLSLQPWSNISGISNIDMMNQNVRVQRYALILLLLTYINMYIKLNLFLCFFVLYVDQE